MSSSSSSDLFFSLARLLLDSARSCSRLASSQSLRLLASVVGAPLPLVLYFCARALASLARVGRTGPRTDLSSSYPHAHSLLNRLQLSNLAPNFKFSDCIMVVQPVFLVSTYTSFRESTTMTSFAECHTLVAFTRPSLHESSTVRVGGTVMRFS
jgi:hypothetical protein